MAAVVEMKVWGLTTFSPLGAPATGISETPSFAFWRNSAVRTAELIGLRPVAMPKVTRPSQPVASEIHREAN